MNNIYIVIGGFVFVFAIGLYAAFYESMQAPYEIYKDDGEHWYK